tara:strand:- start:793 stop:2076 length:1284 start_codon:yes stop_codon:yes gene_type:complete
MKEYETALKGVEVAGVLLHSGSLDTYFGDDRVVDFNAYSHYLRWIPINKPDQFVLYIPGEKPKYFQVIPNDYWHEQKIECGDWIYGNVNVVPIKIVDEIKSYLKNDDLAYIGPNPTLAEKFNISTSQINCQEILNYLNFKRAYKTEYEVLQIKEANKLAIVGHQAARECFLNDGNEYEIHMAYLKACSILESDSPYTNIVALGEKSAILHYQNKRNENAQKEKNLLIDAGCRINGYASDITRTSVKMSIDSLYRDLLVGMEYVEQELVNLVKPGVGYPDLHSDALIKIGKLLLDHSICFGSLEGLLNNEIPHLFMPHGVGHLLGVQVHDLGGHLKDINGTIEVPPAHSPFLRNTRVMSENMVFTVEPGCYFIPSLLEAQRNTKKGKLINWRKIEQLYPYGGIRIEDNILVTKDGPENLTRQFEAINS